jgi:hypothetical protein
MNERIRELAKQAGFAMKIDDDPNSPPGWWGAGHDPTFEKFAELIVRECARCVTQPTIQAAGQTEIAIRALQDVLANDMKAYFGVKDV